MPGYNDLQTTAPELIAEWDFEKNTESPRNISRYSMYSYWWKCESGHSYKAKAFDRAVEGRICSVCEKEYLAVFPQLVVSYYARKSGREIILNDEKLIGIPLETFVPEEGIAIEAQADNEKVDRIKRYLCSFAGVKLLRIPFMKNDTESEYAERIKNEFIKLNIFIKSDVETDVNYIRKRYFKWKKAR